MYLLPVEWGVFVTEVRSGSPAEQAGLQPGDILTQIGKVELDETHSYINALFQHKPGETVELGLVRNGGKLQVQIVLGES